MVFVVNFVTIVIYKKVLVKLYHEIAVDTMAFLDILFLKLSKFLSGISDLFLLPHTGSFYRLTGTSRVKSFSTCQTIFSDHTNLTFKSLSEGASAGFSNILSPFTHLWCFQALELFKFYFHHPPYWWLTDSWSFGDFPWC